MRTQITFKEALIDSVRFYAEDTSRRSRVGGDCFYLQNDGHRCAIGRFIRKGNEDFFRSFDKHDQNNGNIEGVVHAYQRLKTTEGVLFSEEDAIKELTVITDATLQDLNSLQVLHDEDLNWDKEGLTNFGKDTITTFYPNIASEVLQEVEEVLMNEV